jgi:hypothetical protein
MSIISAFPNLNQFPPFLITSPFNPRYNCVAYAYGKYDNGMWPNHNDYWWPPQIPNEMTIRAFQALFESIAFNVCGDGSFEPGYLKIAIFADNNNIPTHAAKQLDNGFWSSKLGRVC